MNTRSLRSLVFAISALVLGGLPAHAWGQEQENGEEENASRYTVTFPRPSSTFVLGSSAVVPYDFRSRGMALLEMNNLGVPRQIRFELTDSDGEKVGCPEPSVTYGPPLPLGPEEQFWTAPNEVIQLNLYLDQLFQIETAGQYVLSAWNHEQKLAETDIVFAEKPDGDPLVVTEYCFQGLGLEDGGATVECSIRVGNPGEDATDGTAWLLSLESEVQTGDDPVPPLSPLTMEVRPHTKVATAVLDYRWQLWLLLECGEEQSLVVVPLKGDPALTLAPWSEAELRLGQTRVFSHTTARIALGGVVGEPLHSTDRVFAGLYEPTSATQDEAEESGN